MCKKQSKSKCKNRPEKLMLVPVISAAPHAVLKEWNDDKNKITKSSPKGEFITHAIHVGPFHSHSL